MSAKPLKPGHAVEVSEGGEAMAEPSYLDQIFREEADPKDREKIEKLTASFGLCADAGYHIYTALEKLRFAKNFQHEYTLTPSERASALQAVAESCESLTRALSRVFLTQQDAGELERAYDEIASKRASTTIVAQGDWRAFCSSLSVFFSSASACGAAALTTRESIPNYGKAGGRRPTQNVYAEQVEILFYACLPSGIFPGRGGKFERLCADVWALAGIPAGHEGPLRHFLKERWPDIKKRIEAGDFDPIPNRKKPKGKRAG